MGQTLRELSKKNISPAPVFPRRFCVEVCEKFHTHYKNLRIVNSTYDWVNLAEGFRDALDRWKRRGCPTARKGQHIELCRKEIISEFDNEELLINLNNNLYNVNEGSIFAKGAEFTEPTYIHLKIRDMRLELSLDDFRKLAEAVDEAREKLDSDINP